MTPFSNPDYTGLAMDCSISVVIPVYNSAGLLKQCLEALRDSDLQPAECIVVDDGSTDESARVAAGFGTMVLSSGRRCGPARARNMGAKAARGDVLLFLDSDVCVHRDTISRVAAEFSADPALDAIMGSYDSQPRGIGYLSQFRNLLHHFVHQHSNRTATTFWAGCGAIRRSVFLEFGGFNEMYRSPSIEDIELGYRLNDAGRRLTLAPEIQVAHLKSWSFRGMMRTDFFYRALPWSELSLSYGRMPNDLNVRITQRISVVLSIILTLLAGYLALHAHAYFLTPLLVTFFLLLSQYWVESTFARSTGAMVSMVVALGAIGGLSYWFRMYAIFPAVLAAWMGVFLRHRYAYSGRVWRKRTGVVVGGYVLTVIGYAWFYLPWHPLEGVFLILGITLLMLNQQFYAFLAADRGKLFAIAAIPFHLLYFVSSGLAFAVAVIRHGARTAIPRAGIKPATHSAGDFRARTSAR